MEGSTSYLYPVPALNEAERRGSPSLATRLAITGTRRLSSLDQAAEFVDVVEVICSGKA